MTRSPHVSVEIDLSRIRAKAIDIRSRTGVAVLAVVKADAYGLGAYEVSRAVADIVDGFYVFTLSEAVDARLAATGKPTLALNAERLLDPEPFVRHRVRPAVWDAEAARALRSARPVLSVDTGMQRFACPPDAIDAVIEAGGCDEAFTHATRIEHVEALRRLTGDRGMRLHAAGSALLDEPAAWLDAVRPGLALYRDAVRVSTRVVEARDTAGPAGYGGFECPRVGVILAGYSNGLRPGSCLIDGRPSRVIEAGMQSAFVELSLDDPCGAGVVLLGDGLSAPQIAGEWNVSPQEVLVRYSSAGVRAYGLPVTVGMETTKFERVNSNDSSISNDPGVNLKRMSDVRSDSSETR